MSYTRMRVEVEGKIGNIILNQPDEFNRMPPAFWQEFPRAVQELDARGDVRVLIISSEGKHFTSGMDTTVFTTPRDRAGSTDRGRMGEGGPRGVRRPAELRVAQVHLEGFIILDDKIIVYRDRHRRRYVAGSDRGQLASDRGVIRAQHVGRE